MDIQKARKGERCNMMLKHLTHTMWPLKICYVPKYVQINKSLRLVECPIAIYREKCEVQIMLHQTMSLQDPKFPAHLTHLLWGVCN